MPLIQSLQQRVTAAINAFKGSADPLKRARQATSKLPSAISTAHARVDGAKNFIASLPVVVGPAAHQRIAEAEAGIRYAMSVQTSDPVSALGRARQAADLAYHAGQLAQADANAGMRGYDSGPMGRNVGGSGGGFARGLGAGVLGGIAGNMLFGGLFEERNGEGREFDVRGGDDSFGGDPGGFGGGDDGSF